MAVDSEEGGRSAGASRPACFPYELPAAIDEKRRIPIDRGQPFVDRNHDWRFEVGAFEALDDGA